MNELMKQAEVEKWLTGRTRGTQSNYLSALKAYLEFTGLDSKRLIDQMEDDRKKSPREQGLPELQINKFYEWLVHDYVQKSRGSGRERRKINGKVGVSETLADSYCMAIRGFYKANGFEINGSKINIPEPVEKEENSKLQLRRDEVRKLLDVAGSIRDRTIILLQYQTFQGVSEVCRLNYGHVQKGLESNAEFIVAENFRQKRKVKYHFVMGSEVVELLRLCLDQRRKTGEKLEFNTPLFVKEGKKKGKVERITPNLIENMLKDLALKGGLVSEAQMKAADLNPCRPHALRSSGMTVAKLSGIPEVAVEYMAGHKLDKTTQAYWQTRAETELRDLYAKHYHSLRVLKPAIDEVKVKELETKVLKREDLVDQLVQNGKMKDEKIETLTRELEALEREHVEFKRKIEKEVSELKKMLEELAA